MLNSSRLSSCYKLHQHDIANKQAQFSTSINFFPLIDKLHMFAQPCNIFCILYYFLIIYFTIKHSFYVIIINNESGMYACWMKITSVDGYTKQILT